MELAREAYAIREPHLGDLHPDAIAAKKSLKYIESKNQQYLRQQQRKAGGLKSTSTATPKANTTSSASLSKPGSSTLKSNPVDAKQSAASTANDDSQKAALQFEVAAAGSLTLGEHHMD